MKPQTERKILVIYTGGTIGMKKEGGGGWKPGSLGELRKNIPELDKLPYQIDWEEMKTKNENERETFIDSSQADIKTFNNIGEKIKENYEIYDGFVVVYGTDTMAYAAGALSYMLEGLGKPVVFTGSMDPATERNEKKSEYDIQSHRITKKYEKEGSDGPRNLIDAINVVGQSGNEIPLIPEVTIAFNGRLIRGNTTEKFKANQRDAFYYNKQTQIQLAKIRHGEDESDVEEHGLPCVFPPECEITMYADPVDEARENFQLRELSSQNICRIEVCSPTIKFIDPGSDAIFLYDTPKELKFDPELISKIESEREDTPVFYHGANPPVKDWISIVAWNDKQAEMKINYILSRTRDIDEIRKLSEGNLRGEGEGPLLKEFEILNEPQKEFSPGKRK